MIQIPDSAGPLISIREFAKRRGVSHPTVSKAIHKGRLVQGVARSPDGKLLGLYEAIALREWEANTDLTRAPAYVKEREAARADAGEPAPFKSDDDPENLAEASLLEKKWKAKSAELKFRQDAGELIPAADVERRLVDVFTACKTKLLGVPSRARQELPHLTLADLAVLDRLVREALEELANRGVE